MSYIPTQKNNYYNCINFYISYKYLFILFGIIISILSKKNKNMKRERK